MLVVTALGGGGDYNVEMPSMKECLDARVTIAEQDPNVKTLCVPMSDETAKVQEFFDIFMDMIQELKREGESYGIDRFEQCDRQWDKCNEQSHSESIRNTE